MAEEQSQEQLHHILIPVVTEERHQEQEPSPICDVDRLEHDPGLRVPIASYNVNDQNAIRREYILKGPCQPYAHDYPTRNIYGLPCCGHDESEESSNKGNFLELLDWLAGNNEEVNKVVLKNAPRNSDESSDISHKEQLALCLHYVDKLGRLQLIFVVVAKGNVGCATFFGQVSRLLNIIGVSCKRHDMLRDVRAQKLKTALELGEIDSGSGLNQEMVITRPGDTRWGSYYKTILHIIDMYSTIREVLITLGKDPKQRNNWPNIHAMVDVLESFEFVFNAHLILIILGYTNELSQSLQKRDQDIVNAMSLVTLAKGRLQQMRSHGWEEFFEEKVKLFCIKHGIDIPALDGRYVPHARSPRFYPVQTIDDHYRREVYIGVIDQIR
ncbi:uncharacterized protein LOC133892160 [Phragmites australis]|uniref:uncharacterized protein LOC133892160 n=1 Tax=Phragmites australis TaxID=29695 RepID=UPI002D7A35DF|nr:uncharacterized protein LOC133892160 [Phragmites australis]